MAAGIKMPLGMEVGLGPDDIVLDGDLAPLPKKGAEPTAPKFSAYVYCGQTAGWIKMVVSIEVDGDAAPSPKRGLSPRPNFRPISIVAKRLNASRCHLV